MEKFYSIREFAKILNVSAQTLRNWDANGRLHPHHTSPSGYRYYSQTQLNQIIGIKPAQKRIVIGYCRVSVSKRKDALDRQSESMRTYLNAQGNPYEIILDVGSGINCNRKGLQTLLRKITQNQVQKVVILNRDRLLLFGFELFEYLARLYDCEIEIVDNSEKTEQQELIEDLIQIIDTFSCKLHGRVSNVAQKLMRELMQNVET